MSPRVEQAFETFVGDLRKGLGVSADDLKLLEQAADKAMADRDFSKLAEIAQQLNTLSNLSDELGRVKNPFASILEKHGLADIDIPFSLQSTGPEVRIPRQEITMPETERKYVHDVRLVIARSLTKKDRNGEFVITSLDQIVSSILMTGRKTKKDKADARQYYATAVYQLTSSFEKVSLATGVKSITELVDQILENHVAGKVRDRNWIKFYKEVKEEYGSMPVSEFVEKVLQRFYTRGEKEKAKKQREKEEKELLITPAQIEPVHELLLCNRLILKDVLPQISTQLLGGKDPEEVARQHGWRSIVPLYQAFSESREEMAILRKNHPITEKEEIEFIQIIERVLKRMAESRRGWHNIDQKYKAFQFLFYLMADMGSVQNIAYKMLKVLYPKREFYIDTSGMVLPGTNQ